MPFPTPRPIRFQYLSRLGLRGADRIKGIGLPKICKFPFANQYSVFKKVIPNSASKFAKHFLSSNQDGIPDRGEGRGVTQVELSQLLHGHARMESCRTYVNALGHARAAHHLRAQQAATGAVRHKLYDDIFPAQVSRVLGGTNGGGARGKACLTGLRKIQASSG